MHKRVTLIAIAFVIVVMRQACAQEVSCRHFFMNSSEKRICATPELMQLNQQMAELARRVELHLDSYKTDQKQFRTTLKACQGDVSCLKGAYENRIHDLQAVTEALPPPSAEELADLQKAAEKADKKRESQAAARAMWARKLAESDAVAPTAAHAPPEDTPIASASSVDKAEIAVAASAPVAPESVQALPEPAQVATVLPPANAETTESPKPLAASGDDTLSWGALTFFGVLAFLVIAWVRNGLRRLFKVCPRCKKWNAGIEIDRNSSSHTDYVTRTYTDVHRDRNGAMTGRTTKQRQAKIRVTDTVVRFKCRHCNNTWSLSSQHRAG